MKKIFYAFLTLAVAGLIFISCSDNKESNNSSSFNSRNDLINVSNKHSEGLQFCLNQYKNKFGSINNSLLNKNGDVDTLAVFKFFETQTKTYLGGNPISYNNMSLGLNYYVESSDSIKLQEMRKMFDTAEFKDGTEVMKSYYTQIKEIIYNNDYDVTKTNEELDKLFVKSQKEIQDDNDKRVAQIMIGVASDSNEFWSNQYDEEGNQLNKIDPGTVLADIYGAGEGALWGSAAAGPLGGVMMGISWGIINSGVSHAISHAHIRH